MLKRRKAGVCLEGNYWGRNLSAVWGRIACGGHRKKAGLCGLLFGGRGYWWSEVSLRRGPPVGGVPVLGKGSPERAQGPQQPQHPQHAQDLGAAVRDHGHQNVDDGDEHQQPVQHVPAAAQVRLLPEAPAQRHHLGTAAASPAALPAGPSPALHCGQPSCPQPKPSPLPPGTRGPKPTPAPITFTVISARKTAVKM